MFQISKFDTALVKAIAGKTITLSELIAHVVPLNNLDSINKAISALVEADFLGELKTVREKKAPDEPMLKNPEQVFPDVKRTFELRHIFAHEGDINFTTDAAEVKRCFYSAESFLKASEEYPQSSLPQYAPKPS